MSRCEETEKAAIELYPKAEGWTPSTRQLFFEGAQWEREQWLAEIEDMFINYEQYEKEIWMAALDELKRKMGV